MIEKKTIFVILSIISAVAFIINILYSKDGLNLDDRRKKYVLFIVIFFVIIPNFYYFMFIKKEKYDFSGVPLVDKKIIFENQVITPPPANSDVYSYSATVSKAGDLLYSISNLPKNKNCGISFNDFNLSIKSDNDGNYTFIEPLPVCLLIYNDIKIGFDMEEIIANNEYIVTGNYKNFVNRTDKSNLASNNPKFNINIKLTQFIPGSIKDVIKKYIISDGSLMTIT